MMFELSLMSMITNAGYTTEIIKISSNEVINRLKLCGLDFGENNSNDPNILRFAFCKDTAMILLLAGNDSESEADTQIYDQDLLASACKLGNLELVQLLLEQGFLVDVLDSNFMTPLNLACKMQYIDIVRLLLDWDADIEQHNNFGFGYRPIQTACMSQNLELVKFLIDSGAELNVLGFDNSFRPLDLAIHLSNYELVSLLINSGADVNAADEYNNTPLHLVTDEKIARLLIESGANVKAVNEKGCTPLHYVRNDKIARILIEAGANINAVDEKGSSKLHMICRRDGLKYAKITENSFGIDLTAPLDDSAALAIAKLLIESGADINIFDHDGNTPLHLASKTENVALVRLLIDSGADVRANAINGSTPLSIAVEKEKNIMEIVKILKENEVGI